MAGLAKPLKQPVSIQNLMQCDLYSKGQDNGWQCIVREGTGAGHGNTKQGIGINHESAIKEAETDAKKTCIDEFWKSIWPVFI